MDINLEDHLLVDGNPALYRQLVLNLLQNAAKYGGDHIRVHLVQQENQVILQVEDNEPGIPDAAKEHIFEPFFRVDRSRSRRIGGNGLGLSIVRRIYRPAVWRRCHCRGFSAGRRLFYDPSAFEQKRLILPIHCRACLCQALML